MINYHFIPKTETGFNLYGLEDINFIESKEGILRAFKEQYEELIKRTLKELGLRYMELTYYSPKTYNFSGDSLTLSISNRINKELWRRALLEHKEELNKALESNKSYDGYMALSVDSVKEELSKLNKSFYEMDCLILNWILNRRIDFKGFNIYESVIWEESE